MGIRKFYRVSVEAIADNSAVAVWSWGNKGNLFMAKTIAINTTDGYC